MHRGPFIPSDRSQIKDMCHTIVTTTIDCPDPTHGDYRHVACEPMWFQPWYFARRCRNKRIVYNELVQDCEICLEEGPERAVEPWEPIVTDDQPDPAESSREASPEVWQWSDVAEDGEEADDEYTESEDSFDEESGVAVEEYCEEPNHALEPRDETSKEPSDDSSP